MQDNFSKLTNKRIVDHVQYRNTVIVGEVTAVHINGTYDVKLSGEADAYVTIPTIFTNPDFEVGESVGVQFGYGNRGSPMIIGRDRRKIQTPVAITYNYV